MAVFALAFVVAACNGGDPAQTAPDDTRAEGEVLGGTIDDGMIPLDQLRSQSPPRRPVPTAAPTGGAASPAAEDPGNEEPGDGSAPGEEPEPAAQAADQEQ